MKCTVLEALNRSKEKDKLSNIVKEMASIGLMELDTEDRIDWKYGRICRLSNKYLKEESKFKK